jgi:hypothetical protein
MGHHYVSKGRNSAEIIITMSLDGYENMTDKLSKSDPQFHLAQKVS